MQNKFASALKVRQENQAPSQSEQKPQSSSAERPSRRGTKHVGGYFDPTVSKQLRAIALEEDSSVQQLLAEAIDMLFQSRQKPTIACKHV